MGWWSLVGFVVSDVGFEKSLESVNGKVNATRDADAELAFLE
jgi:hypothetical protein